MNVKTRVETILLENQSVLQDIESQKNSPESLTDTQRTYTILNYIHRSYPLLWVVLRWFPGHTGVEGKEKVDKLAKKAAVRRYKKEGVKEAGIAAFISAIKDWGNSLNKNTNWHQ